jgi:riboflavin biosynthesis pyrimidine reductase
MPLSVTVFQRLHPDPAELAAHEALAALRPRERAPGSRPFVYLNMVSSADGRATLDGRSHELGGGADTEMLVELRGLADAVLIGPGTLAAEGYGDLASRPERRARRRAAGLAERPWAVVLSRSGRVPWDAGLFSAAEQPVLVYTGAPVEPPAVAAPVTVHRLEDPSPEAVLGHLRREHGVRALLGEGGPTLNGALFDARVVDELFLTLAPLLAGDRDAPRIVEHGALRPPPRLDLQWILRHHSELYLRYAVA